MYVHIKQVGLEGNRRCNSSFTETI